MTSAVIDARESRRDFVVTRRAGRFRCQRLTVTAVDGIDLRVEAGELLRLPGVELTESTPDGRVLTFSLDSSRTPAGELVATMAALGALRDISIAEPAIEDVIARLYTADPSGGGAEAGRDQAARESVSGAPS